MSEWDPSLYFADFWLAMAAAAVGGAGGGDPPEEDFSELGLCPR